MSNTCQFIVAPNGLKCGTSVHQGTECIIHSLLQKGPITDVHLRQLRQYIADSSNVHRGPAYLSQMSFARIRFVTVLNNHHDIVDFSSSSFEGCNFTGHVFSSYVSFINSRFSNTNFVDNRFRTGVDFSNAIFEGTTTPFDMCTFQTDENSDDIKRNEILFVRTIFNGTHMPFPRCSISGQKVSFESAVIKSDSLNLNIHKSSGDVYDPGYLSISSEEINLSNLIFNGHFEYRQDPEHRDHSPVLHLERLMFPSMEAVAFIGANLKKACFCYSVLDNINFVDPHWLRWPNDPQKDYNNNKGKKILYEESLFRGKESNDKPSSIISRGELVRLYMQLRCYFEKGNNYQGAGDWFFREMTLRREIADNEPRFGSMNSFIYRITSKAYNFISRYGESVGRPIIWILITWFITSYLYMMGGFDLGEGTVVHRTFEFSWDIGGTVDDFIWSLLFSATIFFRLGDSLKSLTGWEYFIFLFQSISTITLVPLFLLALRRKFRR